MGGNGRGIPTKSIQILTHPREETKRINMRRNTGSTRYLSKALLDENQCAPVWAAVMHTSRHHYHWMFPHYQLPIVRNTEHFSLLLLMLSFVFICSRSHDPSTCPWHLYSFCSICRLCISKCRFHSWHVGGVLAGPNRMLRCWKSGWSRGPKKTQPKNGVNLFYQSKHAIQRALLLRHANALLQEFWIANTSVFGDVNASRTGTSSFESRSKCG